MDEPKIKDFLACTAALSETLLTESDFKRICRDQEPALYARNPKAIGRALPQMMDEGTMWSYEDLHDRRFFLWGYPAKKWDPTRYVRRTERLTRVYTTPEEGILFNEPEREPALNSTRKQSKPAKRTKRKCA